MRNPLPTALALAILTPAAQADDACQPVLAAMTKYMNTPSHLYSITTRPNAPPVSGETIHAGTQRYLLMRGTWRVSRMTTAAMLAQEQENVKTGACRVLREETVNGEPAIVYEVVQSDPDVASKGELTVSKRSGLPLKSESTSPEFKNSTRYEYTNIQAPAVGP